MAPSGRAFVFGGNHHNTLGVIRSLGREGIASELLLVDDMKGTAYVSKSSYVSRAHRFSSYGEGVEYLLDIIPSLTRKEVVICCSDGASSAVDMNFDKLSPAYYVPNCGKQGEISRLMSKELLASCAVGAGLNAPETWLSENGSVPSGIRFPVIVKPLYSKDGSKTDIRVCRNMEELSAYFQQKHCAQLQLQAFIEKDFEYQLIGCSVEGGKVVVIPGVSKVIRPSDTSNTGFLLYDRLDDSYPVEKVKQMLSGMNYSGLFSAEFLRDKNGKDYFLEVNFRNDGNAIAVTAAGVNLPYIWYRSASDQELPVPADIKPVYVMPEFDDLALVFRRRISFGTWLKDMRRASCYMEFDKADWKPGFYRVLDMLALLFRKMGKR